MAIGTYAELQTAVGNWLDYTTLSSRIPEYIVLFEAQVNRRLRVRNQTTTATLTPSNGVATLPVDYLGWKRVTWNGSPTANLTYSPSDRLYADYPDSPSGNPQKFTIEGSNLIVRPVSATTIDLLYSQKLPALSDLATTNWLLTNHPDAYLFGSLTMSATMTGDAEEGQAWNALTQNILGELWGLDFAQHGSLACRTTGPTP